MRSFQLFCHCRLHRIAVWRPLEEFVEKFIFTRLNRRVW